jgi:eukaryotic-like serine/threonine-protein kinase
MPLAAHDPSLAQRPPAERYQVLRRLGGGGLADVFEALDKETGELVALKILREGTTMPARAAREVEAASALDHPGIVALYDACEDGRRVCLVWELVDGEPLDRLHGELGDADVAAVGAELFEALAFAHSQGVVHRDVKPQNVMLDAAGHVKVMDFGIARLLDADTLTGEGDLIGTVAYMSPEQAAGRRVGPQTDVYSAGLMLYELLTGENPLRGETPAETLSNVAAGRLPPLAELRPDLPSALLELIDAACAPRPADRPAAVDAAATVRDLLEAGGLDDRRLRRAREAVRPLGRVATAAERGAGASLAAATCAAVLAALPAYPSSWALPLVALTFAVWAVVPPAGLAWLLGVLAFPLFDVSFSVGVAYLALAAVVVAVGRRRPLLAVWPALAVLLAPLGLALLAPALAAVFGRLRGALTAAWTGAVLFVVLLLEGVPRGPFTMYQGRGPLAERLSEAGDPLTVALGALAVPASLPALTQAAVFAGLAAALACAFRLDRLEYRLWIWAGAFSGVFLLYRLLPLFAWERRATPGSLLLSVSVTALVILLPLVLWPGPRPEDTPDEHPEVD